MTVEIVFETHSWTVDNENGIATGWYDGELSERGRLLAAELGRRRRDDGIAAVYTSDLGRAVQTAQIAFAGTGVPVHPDPRLRECNYGELNGGPVKRLDTERSRRVREPFPGGESYADTADRMADFLAELARGADGRRVLLIGHTATRWGLDHLLHGLPLEHLVQAPFDWREGWLYLLPAGWQRAGYGADQLPLIRD